MGCVAVAAPAWGHPFDHSGPPTLRQGLEQTLSSDSQKRVLEPMDEDGLQSGQEFVAGFICGDKSRFLIQILDLKLLDGHLQGLQERGFGCLQEFSFGSFALGSGPGSRGGAMYH